MEQQFENSNFIITITRDFWFQSLFKRWIGLDLIEAMNVEFAIDRWKNRFFELVGYIRQYQWKLIVSAEAILFHCTITMLSIFVMFNWLVGAQGTTGLTYEKLPSNVIQHNIYHLLVLFWSEINVLIIKIPVKPKNGNQRNITIVTCQSQIQN